MICLSYEKVSTLKQANSFLLEKIAFQKGLLCKKTKAQKLSLLYPSVCLFGYAAHL